LQKLNIIQMNQQTRCSN